MKVQMMMKKSILIRLLPVLLLMAACYPETIPEWSNYQYTTVSVGEDNGVTDETSRLLILNQGIFPSYSSIDLLDFKTQRYYSDLFTQANPKLLQNIGTEASEMAIVYGQLWVLLSTSNQIAIIDLPSFTLVEFLSVNTPRHLVVDGSYVYVSSYGTAATTESSAMGKIYKINAATRRTSYIYVGTQPEGLSVLGEKLYAADSGHLSWPRGKKVNVINLKKFAAEKQVELPVTHPNQVIARGARLWINTFGDSDWSSIDEDNPPLTSPHSLVRMGSSGSGRIVEGVHAEKMVLDHRTLYVFGNAAELEGGRDWHLYKVDADGDEVIDIPFAGTDLERVKYPNDINIHPDNGDIYMCETMPDKSSQLHCFDKDLKHKWSVPTGTHSIQVLFW